MFCMSEHKILPMVILPNQDCLFHFVSDDWSIAFCKPEMVYQINAVENILYSSPSDVLHE